MLQIVQLFRMKSRGVYFGCARSAGHTLWNWTCRGVFQVVRSRENHKKARKMIIYFLARSRRTPWALDSPRIRRDICVNCFCSCDCEMRCSRVEGILLTCLFLLCNLTCATFQKHTCRFRKLVIHKTIVQSFSSFLQLWPALVQGWVHFTPLVFRSRNPGCALFQTHTFWSRQLVFTETFVQTVFAVVNWDVVGLSAFYSLVLT